MNRRVGVGEESSGVLRMREWGWRRGGEGVLYVFKEGLGGVVGAVVVLL